MGPTLWNLFDDEILETKVDGGVTLVANADAMALVVTGKNKVALTSKVKIG